MSANEYEIVIGLEIHAELLTESKVFGGEPNTRCCPICLGLPGVLPVLNKKAVEYTIMTGLALNCEIAEYSKFDRKNYFYPDLPKAYQISQYDLPLCRGGYLEIPAEDGTSRRVGIRRVHLEEETGKSIHSGDSIVGSEYSLIDYNRTGIPLIEIVSEPDIRSPKEARLFLERLKSILEYLGVSDCKMEEGSLRCDANVSVRPKGSTEFGVKTEVKNMNSFRAVQRALEHEAERQIALLEAGERVVQETRHWDESLGVTLPMRGKEEAHDYRYFPEPDLVPLIVDRSWVESLRARLPELPAQRQERFSRQYGLPAYDASVLTSSKALADFYESCVERFPDPKTVSNWVMGELLGRLNAAGMEVGESKVTPEALAALLGLIEKGTITGKIAKDVFDEMFATGKSAATIVQERGLTQISDEGVIAKTLDEVIAAANNTRYGLAAYVFTNDLTVMWRMAEGLEAGIIGINDPVPATPQCPFGGMKESGLGRELAHEGLEAYLETKYVSLALRG